MSKKVVVPEASFGVASWLLLSAIIASTPDLKSREREILDRVLLSFERLQARDADDDDIAALYAGARRLLEGVLRQSQI